MKIWMIKKIANGFTLMLLNGQEEFFDRWANVMFRLEEIEP